MYITRFDDVLSLLDKLGLFHMDFSLHRMEAALALLHLSCLPCPVVQIVGTNGKGSTSVFLANLLQEHGLRVGLSTSPHFVTFRERARIDGQMLSLDTWVSCVRLVHEAAPELTYFELLTLAGLVAFVQADVDVIILEAGLGGHYDATTAITADIVCFTPIHLDHEKILGETIEIIATEKSHAIRTGKPVLTVMQDVDVAHVLRTAATAKGCAYHEIAPITNYTLGLFGVHQQTNAGLALAAFKQLCQDYAFEYNEEHVVRALAAARIAGRLQWIQPDAKSPFSVPLLLDGAHNVHGLKALTTTIKALTVKPVAIIFSCLADKDLEQIVPHMQALAALCGGIPFFVPTIMDNERAMTADELALLLGSSAVPCARMAVALREAIAFAERHEAEQEGDAQRPVLICGSLYLLAEFFILYPEYLDANENIL